jgi:hypothetical protein
VRQACVLGLWALQMPGSVLMSDLLLGAACAQAQALDAAANEASGLDAGTEPAPRGPDAAMTDASPRAEASASDAAVTATAARVAAPAAPPSNSPSSAEPPPAALAPPAPLPPTAPSERGQQVFAGPPLKRKVPQKPHRSALGIWWDHTTPVPIVFFTPENLLGLGAGLMTTWQMPKAWRDRPSNILLFGVYTLRKQTIAGGSYELHFADDRYVFLQDFRYIDWPDRFYGIGNRTRDKDREDFTDHYFHLESEFDYRVWSRMYLGLRHQFRVSETLDLERDGVLATEKPLGVGRVYWSGAGPVLLWDTREGLFWPKGGSLLRADAMVFQRWLGADFNGTLLRLDLRHYQPIWRDHVLALRMLGSGAVGDLPFQLLPALGGQALFRGWFLRRLRDRVMLAAEAEYRIPITPRWAVVAFGSVGRVASRVDKLSFRRLRAAGGAGLRFAVRKESRANIRLDVAYGDAFSVYFQFREAF